VESAARREADAELEVLGSSAVRVRDLVLDGAGEPSSLAMSMSAVTELLKDHIDATTPNEVRCGSYFVLVVPCRISQRWTPISLVPNACSLELTGIACSFFCCP
jgi:hypothetical protein